jgi:hypothetical protein
MKDNPSSIMKPPQINPTPPSFWPINTPSCRNDRFFFLTTGKDSTVNIIGFWSQIPDDGSNVGTLMAWG